ncbi:hypothetical protein Tco_1442576, partial [Tanacetum coccineum]
MEPVELITVQEQLQPTYQAVCEALEAILNGFRKFVTKFGFRLPPKHLLKDLKNKLLMEEKNYKRDLLKEEAAQSVPKLNVDQKKITWDALDLSAMYYPLEMQARLKNTDGRWTLKTWRGTSPSLQCGMTWQNSLTKKRFKIYHPQSSLLSAFAELTNTEVCLTIKDVKLLLRNKSVIPQCAMTDIQLEATPATHYYINPRAPEAEYIYMVFKQKRNLNPPLQVSKYRCKDLEQEKIRNRQTLDTLLQQNPTSFKGIWFTCEAMITSVNENRGW